MWPTAIRSSAGSLGTPRKGPRVSRRDRDREKEMGDDEKLSFQKTLPSGARGQMCSRRRFRVSLNKNSEIKARRALGWPGAITRTVQTRHAPVCRGQSSFSSSARSSFHRESERESKVRGAPISPRSSIEKHGRFVSKENRNQMSRTLVQNEHARRS